MIRLRGLAYPETEQAAYEHARRLVAGLPVQEWRRPILAHFAGVEIDIRRTNR